MFTLLISKDNTITTSAQEHCILYILCRGTLDLGWAFMFMGYIPVDEYGPGILPWLSSCYINQQLLLN